MIYLLSMDMKNLLNELENLLGEKCSFSQSVRKTILKEKMPMIPSSQMQFYFLKLMKKFRKYKNL